MDYGLLTLLSSEAGAEDAQRPDATGAAKRLGGPVTPPGTSQNGNCDNTTYLFPPRWRPTVAEMGSFLCDWLTIIIPVRVPRGLMPSTGLMWFVDGEGHAEGFRHRKERVEGSWSDSVIVSVHDGAIFDAHLARYVNAMDNDLIWFRVDGNPVKWHQGFNLFGSNDVLALAERFVSLALAAIGFGPDSGAVPIFNKGYFNRVDATFNFDLGAESAAASLVQELGKLATIKHRRSTVRESSLVFAGRKSRMIVYHKGPEMRAHPPRRELPGMLEVAQRIVRFEVTSRSERLDEMGLRKMSMWSYDNSTDNLLSLWLSFVSRLRFPVMVDVDVSALSAPARRLYGVWLAGQDVVAFASKSAAYRHRAAIMAAGGPDILLPKPAENATVVHFRRVLRPVPATVPADIAALIYHPRAA